ncbi:uncharacterized protein NPIL_68431 [Nephila pilipes]|uniref:Peptidase aspartic putative domain-containing protein n=1 Tax=Nephila pilipes TaxID=299642 RepID=A0A8X6MGU0_NEPPI|nr:uncharacterized protein NPIL_68431 [Nephila pilipes]
MTIICKLGTGANKNEKVKPKSGQNCSGYAVKRMIQGSDSSLNNCLDNIGILKYLAEQKFSIFLFHDSFPWINSQEYNVNIITFESLNKYASHPSTPIDVTRFAKNKRLKLADPDDSLSNLPIEILIGADFYWNIVNSELPVQLSDSLTLVPSIFGCILSRPRSHATVSFISTVHNINMDTSTQALDDVVRECWSLKSIDLQPIQEEKKYP